MTEYNKKNFDTIMLSIVMLSVTIKPILQSVVMLSVITTLCIMTPSISVKMHSAMMTVAILDKLQLTGRYLGRVFNSGSGCVHAMNLCHYEVKQTNLKLKTRAK